MDSQGVETDLDDLVEKCLLFKHIVFDGDDPLLQKEEVGKLISKVFKKSEETTFTIHTKGVVRPVGIKGNNNVQFIVNVQLKNTKKKYEERIKPSVLNYFAENNSRLLFEIYTEDDVDEADMIVKDIAAAKHKVFLMLKSNNIETHLENTEWLAQQAKMRGYNFTTKFNLFFDMR
jgi:hypothetical protein